MEQKTQCPLCLGLHDNCFVEKTEVDGKPFESYMCFQCGMTTNSHFKDGSPQLKAALEKSPTIIQSLQYKDKDSELVWIPSVINIPAKGMIYPMGDKNNWNWAFSPIIKLSKDEQKKYPIPGTKNECYEQRLGVETKDGLELFGQLEYVEACKKMGITKDIEEQIE